VRNRVLVSFRMERRWGDEGMRNGVGHPERAQSAGVIPSERSESRDLHLGSRECGVAGLRAY